MAKSRSKTTKSPAKLRPQRKTPTRKRRIESYFGLHFDLHANTRDTALGQRVTESMVRRIIKASQPDYIQYDCKGHNGALAYPRSRISASAGDNGKNIVNDSLEIYRKVTAKLGVALYAHFSGVWDNQAVSDHPEWAALDAEGNRSQRHTSTFGPYVTERMIPQMKEVLDRYDLDGFWVDGDCWAAQVDHCDKARKLYANVTGRTEPPTSPDEPGWADWMEIQRDQFFEYVETYMTALHDYRPDVQIASNWLYSRMSPEPVKLPVDFVSGDYNACGSVNSARFNARQLSSVGLPWDLMAWAFASNLNDVNKAPKPPIQLKQEAAVVLALGGGFQMYFQPDRDGGFADWQIDTMGEVADFCHERKKVCFGSEPVPQVAVLLDISSILGKSPHVYAWHDYTPLEGALHATLEAGHSVDVLADHQLAWQQDHWPVVLVPECEALPTSVVYELTEYAKRGGSLLLIGARTAAFFEDELKVDFDGEPREQMAFVQMKGGAVPVRGAWQDVKLRGGRGQGKALAHRTPGQQADVDRTVAATFTKLGKGKVAAIYGPVGSTHKRIHAPLISALIDQALKKLYKPMVTMTGAPAIDLAVRQLGEKLAIHLVNTRSMPKGANDGYVIVDDIPPVGPIELTVKVPGKPRCVTLEPGSKRLKKTWDDGILKVTVPQVDIHSAVVIE